MSSNPPTGETPPPSGRPQSVPPSQRRTVERVRPVRPGNAVLRVSYPTFRGFARRRRGRLEATLELEEPRSPLGRFWRVLIGTPIPNALETNERLPKKKAIAVFSSDALSSVAYAPQESLVVLMAAGAAAITYSLPISLAIIALLAIVVTSYRQTIYTYPSGGGSYIVARANLGEIPGLIAAASLIVGYILTVSVSVASAVDQFVSAVPSLIGLRVGLGVGAVVFVTLTNLRGIRESGNIFTIPTYIFLAAMYSLVATGLFTLLTGTLTIERPTEQPSVTELLTPLLILRAFAVGSAVMTGTEAISNGIPAFKPPESRNAARTLVAMATILGTMFLGLAILIFATGVVPTHEQTVVSLLAKGVFGDGPLYYLVQGSAVLILVLAANTAFADFPRISSLLARDNYAPHQLAFRGERLAFSNGIILLGLLSALLIILFGGSTGALLPLYAFSVFAAFTFSQAGMTIHWIRERGAAWRTKSAINGVGAVMTGIVAITAALTNFMDPNLPIIAGLPVGYGAWLVLVIVPAFVWLFLKVRKHYDEVARLTRQQGPSGGMSPLRNVVVVPISNLHGPTSHALRYARSLSTNVTAVHVAADEKHAEEIERNWDEWSGGIPLTIIDSPYRSLTRPLIQYLAELKHVEQADIITVVLPEYVPNTLWEQLLHGQSAAQLKLLLLFSPGFVVTSVPYHEPTHVDAVPRGDAPESAQSPLGAGDRGRD